MSGAEEVLVLDRRISRAELDRLLAAHPGDRLDFVADLRLGLIAIGGSSPDHLVAALLRGASRPEDLWGASYLPGRGPDGCLGDAAANNLRPASANVTAEIDHASLRARIRELCFARIGQGQEE